MHVSIAYIKAADLQMLEIKKTRINGKYWSSYVQWRNLLKICIFFIFNNYYMYLKRYFEIFVKLMIF